MSILHKMSITGIRSFDPDDKQQIKFFNPLTLILGPNGTGKTTVIECLKYMTTGSMPPGTKGGAFVYDPKVAHETEVIGQVQMTFSDISGKSCKVQRRIQVTQKRKKVEMMTLDGIITRKNDDGEIKSINYNNADLEREMIMLLGVSKPVLENVIFCHQEDSNWPLSEGKALKEKFDSIFDSTRYVKALDAIRKLKQTQEQEVISMKKEIFYLRQNKDKARELEENLEKEEEKLAKSKESVAEITEKLVPIQKMLHHIEEQENEIFKIETDISNLKIEKKEMKKTADELQDKLEYEFQGSTEELEQMHRDFRREVIQLKDKLQKELSRRQEILATNENLVKTKDKLLEKVWRLEQDDKVHEENIKRRDELVRDAAKKYNFTDLRGEITEEKYGNFLENMTQKLDDAIQEGKKLKAKFEEEESELQKKIDEIKETKAKLEQSQHIKHNMMDENNEKVRQINKKLSEVQAASSKLGHLTRDLKQGEQDLRVKEEEVDVENMKKEIVQLGKDKVKLDSQISELNSEMSRLHQQSSVQIQLDFHKKDKLDKEQNVQKLKAKQEDTISYLLGHMPVKNVKVELNDYISKWSDSVKKLQQELQTSNGQLSSCKMEKKMVGESLREKEQELQYLKEKIFTECGSQNFDDGLHTLQQKKKQCQDQKGSLLGAECLIKKYVDDLEKAEPCCPLCHRKFVTDQEVRELVGELREKLKLVPKQLAKTDKDLMEYEKKYDAMMQLKPQKENITVMEDKEIPKLKSDLEKCNEEIANLMKLIQNKDADMQRKEKDVETAKTVIPDVETVDRYCIEVQDLERKIASLLSLLPGGDADKTLQDVISEKEDVQMQLDTVTKKLDHKRQKLTDHSEEVQCLKSRINALKEEKLRIDTDLQQRYKLEEDKATFLSESKTYKAEIQKAKKELQPLQSKIEKLKEKKEKITHLKEEQMEQSKAEIDRVKNRTTSVKNINEKIKEYKQAHGKEKLEKCRIEKQHVDKQLADKEKEKKTTESTINSLRQSLDTQQMREREVIDNLQLRKKMKEIEMVETQIEHHTEKLMDMDVRTMERDRKQYIAEKNTLLQQRLQAEGGQKELEEQIKKRKKELKTDIYKGAAEKYNDQNIIMRTTEIANSDLEKYYKVLDNVIMKYHKDKMDNINKVIRDLWQSTYKGNDIEAIEIRSDEDEGGIRIKRRSYNYRVVMVKGDAVLDMRGRCSTGQKVLASLIIRLALAETFCLHCGVLALDEPTTNLDRENIESLAGALVDILKAREKQKNFQLIVITHSEEFVGLLGRSQYAEEFYEVQKNADGCSQLKRSSIPQLLDS